jgi:hypothetical protein
MQKAILSALMLAVLAAPSLADGSYPVSGKWGQSAGTEKGPVDCSKLRVIEFNGEERTDSGGGVPAFRLRSIEPEGTSSYRVVDEFTTGQISNAQANYTLKKIDADRIELNMTPGGLLKLQRCK